MTTRLRSLTILTAATAVVSGLLAGAPAAAARTGPVLHTFRVASGGYALAAGLNAIWAVNADEFHDAQVYEINPTRNSIRLVRTLPFPAGGVTVAYGSLWITDYFGNAVWRLAPSGHTQAEIGTGLQPQWVHAAFGSVWTSDHHSASLTRIDPATNTVQDTVQVGAPNTFRNGPQDITSDATNLYAVSSNLPSLQSVNPSTDAVTTSDAITDDAFCGPIDAVGGFVWSVDQCTGNTFRLGTDGSQQQVIASTGVPKSLADLNGSVWVGEDTTGDPNTGQGSDAALEQRDPQTGALLRSVAVGGDASDLESGFGDLWVYDSNVNTIRRVHV